MHVPVTCSGSSGVASLGRALPEQSSGGMICKFLITKLRCYRSHQAQILNSHLQTANVPCTIREAGWGLFDVIDMCNAMAIEPIVTTFAVGVAPEDMADL